MYGLAGSPHNRLGRSRRHSLNFVSICIWAIAQCNEDSGARTFHGYVRCSRTTLWLLTAACGLFAHPNYLNLVYRLGRRCCSRRTAQAQASRLTRAVTKKSKPEIKLGRDRSAQGSLWGNCRRPCRTHVGRKIHTDGPSCIRRSGLQRSGAYAGR